MGLGGDVRKAGVIVRVDLWALLIYLCFLKIRSLIRRRIVGLSWN